ncbi:hypothetical protein WAI453_012675 [Rhynchosporium graminicola]
MASQALDIIMNEGVITDSQSPATDVDAAIMHEMVPSSRHENTAPASIMDDTTPTGDFASSNEDASTSTIEETNPGAPASIMNDTASTGDLAPSSEDATPASIIEDTIPLGIRLSTPIDVPTGQLSEDTVEAIAPANIIEETMPDDRETSIRNEASTHVNIPDPTSGKAIVDEDSTIVAMDESALIPVERTGGEELSVVSASAGNVDYDTIIVEEEEDARFELDKEGPQVEMT